MIKRKRRWLAWLTLANYVFILGTAFGAKFFSPFIGFCSCLFLICYNYFIVKVFISLPRVTEKAKRHYYLIIPFSLSVLISVVTSAAVFLN